MLTFFLIEKDQHRVQQKLILAALVKEVRSFQSAVRSVRRVTIRDLTFIFKISQKMPNMASFVAKELPDIDNYLNLINYKF